MHLCHIDTFLVISVSEPDPVKLFITGFDKKMTKERLAAMFPEAVEISFPKKTKRGRIGR